MTVKNDQIDITKFGSIPETVQSEDHQLIYANSTRIGISPWDVQITFGHVVEREAGKTVNVDKVTIVLTPSQAKAVVHNLSLTLKTYEDMFGEISDPIAAIQKAQAARAMKSPLPKIVAVKERTKKT